MTFDLPAIRAREAAATPGPWTTGPAGVVRWRVCDVPGHRGVYAPLTPGRVGYADRLVVATADAEFIAHARADVPALVAEIDRLRALLAEAARW